MDKSSDALEKAAEEVLKINNPDIALYAVINNIGRDGYVGEAYVGGACNNRPSRKIFSKKTSVTVGPSLGVVQTAVVIQYSVYFFFMINCVNKMKYFKTFSFVFEYF